MPALKPLPSAARIEANRQNARKSTGPRTEEGKARSRGNALKHGLAGEGIALPTEDADAVVGRFEAIRDQLRPATPLGEYFARRIATATVRVDRAARHEAAALALRVRRAVAEFDRERSALIDAARARLRSGDAPGARRDLLRTSEGIDALLGELASIWGCLELPEPLWSREHGARLDACLGVMADPIIPSRVEALTAAALGLADDLLTRRDLAAIAEAGITESAFAFGRLAALIDEEMAALRLDRARIDPAEAEADRAEAADRALFDPSPAAQLARRYEAAAAREVRQALDQFRRVEAEAEVAAEAAPGPKPGPEPTPEEPIEESATFARKPRNDNDLDVPLASFGDPVVPPVGVEGPGEGRPARRPVLAGVLGVG